MIKVSCRTNLDLAFGDKGGWPDQLPFRPVVGDYIRSAYIHPGRYVYAEGEAEPVIFGKGHRLELVVCRICVVTEDKESWGCGHFKHLEVELHLPPNRYQSLLEFYKYYEKLTGQKFI